MSVIVMVVDDSTMVRRLISASLAHAGFHVVQAVDGQDTWDQLAEGLRPALIVSDINMPRMNGIELLEAVRTQPATCATPMLMMTVTEDPGILVTGLGSTSWYRKPIQPEQFVSAVRDIVSRAAA